MTSNPRLDFLSDSFDAEYALQNSDAVTLPVQTAKVYDALASCISLLPESDENWRPPKIRKVAPSTSPQNETGTSQLRRPDPSPSSAIAAEAVRDPNMAVPPGVRFASGVEASSDVSQKGAFLLCSMGSKMHINRHLLSDLTSRVTQVAPSQLLFELSQSSAGRKWLNHFAPALVSADPPAALLAALPALVVHSLARSPCPLHAPPQARQRRRRAATHMLLPPYAPPCPAHCICAPPRPTPAPRGPLALLSAPPAALRVRVTIRGRVPAHPRTLSDAQAQSMFPSCPAPASALGAVACPALGVPAAALLVNASGNALDAAGNAAGLVRAGRLRTGVYAELRGRLVAHDRLFNLVLADARERALVWVPADAAAPACGPADGCAGVWAVLERRLSRTLVRGGRVVSVSVVQR